MTETQTKTNFGWNFDNSYAVLPQAFFTYIKPTPVNAPRMVVFNHELAGTLGLNSELLQGEKGVEIFAGNEVPPGAMPLAQAYAGHQFGHFTMLGDGRAVLLGEQRPPSGKRYDIQLKGSGRTPYSRGGDGRAALGPMLREYIISEAMHALGIPTTRSLAVVITGETIIRETELPGAVLTRVASSHLRVGTFEYIARWGKEEQLRTLADYAIKRHYPDVRTENGGQRYLDFLKKVIENQAKLIAKWQLVGFIHGVMNTDNMAISGETIDYGPCAFMDQYDPNTVFSSIDRYGRYAYVNQPRIAVWNLARLAEALLPLIHHDSEQAIKQAEQELADFERQYEAHWLAGMQAKLGLFGHQSEDKTLINDLLELMHQHHTDYTHTFRALTYHLMKDAALEEAGPALFRSSEYGAWHKRWRERLHRQPESLDAALQLMRSSNPAIIPRNHLVEEALASAVDEGDISGMNKLLDLLAKPFEHTLKQAACDTLPEPSNVPYRTFCGT